MIRIKTAELYETRQITLLAQKSFPNLAYDELYQEVHNVISSETDKIYIVVNNEVVTAMAQCELQYNTESPKPKAAILQRICTAEEWQKKHVYKRLLEKCTRWAKRNGCNELVYDGPIDELNKYAPGYVG